MTLNEKLLQKQTVNFLQINKILQKSYKTLETVKRSLSQDYDSSFALTYDSMLKTSLALMLSRGYRPRVSLGHHRTLVDFAKQVLGPKFAGITSTYSRMRKKRNKIIYDVNSVGRTEAEQAIKTAERYFKIVEDKIKQDNPQQKLWKP